MTITELQTSIDENAKALIPLYAKRDELKAMLAGLSSIKEPMKSGMTNTFNAKLNPVLSEIKLKEDDSSFQQSQIDSLNEQAELLAKSGVNMQADIIKAEGAAAATALSAQITATAQAGAIKTSAETSAENSKKRNMIIIAVVSVFLLVVGYVVIRKISKKGKFKN